MMYHNQFHAFPCLHCHPHTYIRMVQNLIERCLLFHMDRDQCVKALAKHARIRPLVTLAGTRNSVVRGYSDVYNTVYQGLKLEFPEMIQRTENTARKMHENSEMIKIPRVKHWYGTQHEVWRELLKENRDFFQSYFKSVSKTDLILTGTTVRNVSRYVRGSQWR